MMRNTYDGTLLLTSLAFFSFAVSFADPFLCEGFTACLAVAEAGGGEGSLGGALGTA